jgi:hypothetical protein
MSGSREDSAAREQRLQEILLPYLQALDTGQAPDRGELLRQHPDLAADLEAFFADQERVDRLAESLRPDRQPAEAPTLGQVPTRLAPLGTVRYFGDYELLEEIARGGMGVVYRARQVSLNRLVALKMILAGQLAGEEEVQRFYGEAQTAARLRHPHIVAIHEVGRHEGQHYFSMAYVEGRSLADLIRDHPLPPAQAARYVKVVAEAIHYAHQQKVLHRDLKPDNILIDSADQPRVSDFGLAKQIDRDKGLTATGAVIGTASYMPPEQASGQRGQLGPASDVYSLGAVLYQLVTGRPPFRAATTLDTLLQVLEKEPAPPSLLNPSISPDLETIILKCLAKEPQRRYESAATLAEDLGRWLAGEPIRARPAGVWEQAVKWVKRQRTVAGLWALSLLVSLISVAALLGVSGAIVGGALWLLWLGVALHLLRQQALLRMEADRTVSRTKSKALADKELMRVRNLGGGLLALE